MLTVRMLVLLIWRMVCSFRFKFVQIVAEDLGVSNNAVQELRVRSDRLVSSRNPFLVPNPLKKLPVLDGNYVNILPAAIVRIQLRHIVANVHSSLSAGINTSSDKSDPHSVGGILPERLDDICEVYSLFLNLLLRERHPASWRTSKFESETARELRLGLAKAAAATAYMTCVSPTWSSRRLGTSGGPSVS